MDIGNQQRVIIVEPIDTEEIVSSYQESVFPMWPEVSHSGTSTIDEPIVIRDRSSGHVTQSNRQT